MERFRRSDYVEIGEVHSGTSAAFVGLNQITGKKGIYKENGCMLGVDNEDIREKMASELLSSLDIDVAQIDLVYDETTNQNACFSNYIISDDESLVEPNISNTLTNHNDKIQNFVDGYIESVKRISTNKKFLKQCKSNVYKNIYMSCIIDSYDLKVDNLPIVHNNRTGENRVAAWFDYGTAFKEDSQQRQAFFYEMSTDEVLESIFSKHFNAIKDIATKVNNTFSKEYIREFFSKEYIKENFDENTLNKIKSRFEGQVNKSCILLEREKTKNKFSCKVKSFLGKFDIFSKKGNIKALASQTDEKNYTNFENDNNFFDGLRKDVNDDKEIIKFQTQRETVEKEHTITKNDDILKR